MDTPIIKSVEYACCEDNATHFQCYYMFAVFIIVFYIMITLLRLDAESNK